MHGVAFSMGGTTPAPRVLVPMMTAGIGHSPASVRRAPNVELAAIGKLPVRQWEPTKKPLSERRLPEDRVRIKMSSAFPMELMECVEVLQDLADSTGAEVEGPIVMPMKRKTWVINRAPKGHKRSKIKYQMQDHTWIMDYYPPIGGGLDALVQVRMPNGVSIKIE